MKTQILNPVSFLTEREQRIAEEVKKLRDFGANHAVFGGTHLREKPSSAPATTRRHVKDSRDR